MVDKTASEWEEEDIIQLISNQREESINLEYKATDSIGKSDSEKKEISKDVSAFANSDGGTIIYGIKTYDDADRKHVPEKIDCGCNPSEYSKEWLENVIISRIKPKIDGLKINPIKLKNNNPENIIYVVCVPKGTTAHQASDFRYYRRYNFQSVPMEDFEIRDVMNRLKYPNLEQEIKSRKIPAEGHNCEYEVQVKLVNKSTVLVHNVCFELAVPKEMVKSKHGHSFEERIWMEKGYGDSEVCREKIPYLKHSYRISSDERVIFPKEDFVLVSGPTTNRSFRCIMNDGLYMKYSQCDIHWRLFADNMPYKEGKIKIKDLLDF